jgi:drug/metabolite transporter (DMT)-like permease
MQVAFIPLPPESLPLSRTQADILVLFAALIWGVAFYFQKIAMEHVGPLTFLGLRAAIASVALAPWALAEGRARAAPPARPILRYALLGGLAFFTGGALQQTGMVTATVTNTSFLTALYVILTPFLLWQLKHEKPGPRVWIAAVMAFVGIWYLGGGQLSAFSQGDMLIAVSSLFWSIYMVITGASGKAGRPRLYTCLHFAVIAALALPLAFLFETVSWAAIRDAAGPILYVGFISTAFTFTIMAIAVRHIPASRASVLLSTEVVFGAAAGFVMLGERLPLIGWLGAALVLAAILLVQTDRKPT